MEPYHGIPLVILIICAILVAVLVLGLVLWLMSHIHHRRRQRTAERFPAEEPRPVNNVIVMELADKMQDDLAKACAKNKRHSLTVRRLAQGTDIRLLVICKMDESEREVVAIMLSEAERISIREMPHGALHSFDPRNAVVKEKMDLVCERIRHWDLEAVPA